MMYILINLVTNKSTLLLQEKISFFKQAIKTLKTSGALFPSSKFLSNRMIDNIDYSSSKIIVEFGAANGNITKLILPKLSKEATLIVFEINENFYQNLLKIEHKQLVVLNKSAEDVIPELKKLGFSSADVVISSLPLTVLPKELSRNILKNANDILKSKGIFNQFQYSLQYLKPLKTIFNRNIKLEMEFLNFPPAFVYKCMKS